MANVPGVFLSYTEYRMNHECHESHAAFRQRLRERSERILIQVVGRIAVKARDELNLET